MAEIEIRRLRTDDDRSVFACGQPDLDRFFHHYAGQNQFKFRVAVTYVAASQGRILGSRLSPSEVWNVDGFPPRG